MALFSRTRLSQLFIATANRLFPARADLNVWRSQEPVTLKGRIAPEDPRLNSALRLFRENLAAILRMASESSPAVMVCTVPVNLRDCAPFSTSYLEDQAAAQQVRETLRAAIAAETATNQIEATRLYADVIRRHPTHAEALFRAAQLALKENHASEAAALFSRARDSDALRLRADSRINDIVRQCASDTSVSLFDAEALFTIRSPQGIPGRELFLDHIHFTFEANHLLASALLDRMEFLRAFDPEPSGPIPGPETLADNMLYNPWGHAAQLDAMIDLQIRPPFRRQLNNTETIARLNLEKSRWDARIAAISPENTRAIFARRQASRPDDAWLAARAAWYMLGKPPLGLSETAALTAHRHWPHRYEIRALLTLIRTLQGQDPATGIAFLRGTEPDSGYYDIALAIQLGGELARQKKHAQARPWFEYALRRDSWNSDAVIALAQTLCQLKEITAAIGILQSAIERNPDNPLLWEEIASVYCIYGNWQTATECFLKSEEIAPYRYERLLKWAKALVRLRRYRRAKPPIDAYLAAMPGDPDGLAIQAIILEHLPQEKDPAPDPATEKPTRKFPWE